MEEGFVQLLVGTDRHMVNCRTGKEIQEYELSEGCICEYGQFRLHLKVHSCQSKHHQYQYQCQGRRSRGTLCSSTCELWRLILELEEEAGNMWYLLRNLRVEPIYRIGENLLKKLSKDKPTRVHSNS